MSKLRRDNTSLDVERHERDKTLNHLRTRIAVLEQENKDNQEVSSSLLYSSSITLWLVENVSGSLQLFSQRIAILQE